MKNTLLLVFIHGFKGSDHTFHHFPNDLQALISHTLPNIEVESITYPQFETRGDLKECVARFKEWLQNKVIDLEVANGTPSPTIDPSVHVILCSHSMGGIVAAEALLSIAHDEPVPPSEPTDAKSTTTPETSDDNPEAADKSSHPTTPKVTTNYFFPHVRAILAFDTPYLGISPGVLAHGAEEHLYEANAAYKWYGEASKFFAADTAGSSTPQPIAGAAQRGLPAPEGSSSSGGKWNSWGKYAMYGGAAAAMAGIAGAAYLNWNQINQGLTWASSHLEFVGCLTRGAELQKRVESVVNLTRTHDVGFANFYSALDEKVTQKTRYAGMIAQDRTFCVVPKDAQHADSPTGSKRSAPSASGPYAPEPPSKRRRSKADEEMEAEMEHGKQVRDYAQDLTKSKGRWVKCVNQAVSDELSSHTSMFAADGNPDYHAMVPRARDQIVEWVDRSWYDESSGAGIKATAEVEDHQHEAQGGAEQEATA